MSRPRFQMAAMDMSAPLCIHLKTDLRVGKKEGVVRNVYVYVYVYVCVHVCTRVRNAPQKYT